MRELSVWSVFCGSGYKSRPCACSVGLGLRVELDMMSARRFPNIILYLRSDCAAIAKQENKTR